MEADHSIALGAGISRVRSWHSRLPAERVALLVDSHRQTAPSNDNDSDNDKKQDHDDYHPIRNSINTATGV